MFWSMCLKITSMKWHHGKNPDKTELAQCEVTEALLLDAPPLSVPQASKAKQSPAFPSVCSSKAEGGIRIFHLVTSVIYSWPTALFLVFKRKTLKVTAAYAASCRFWTTKILKLHLFLEEHDAAFIGEGPNKENKKRTNSYHISPHHIPNPVPPYAPHPIW